MLRLNSFDPDKLATSTEAVERFENVHRAQPGYVASIVVDLAAGQRFVLNLWQSEQHSAAARSALSPEVSRLLNPLMSKPSALIGAGPVLSSDLPPPLNV